MRLYREIIVDEVRVTLDLVTNSDDAHSILSEEMVIRAKVDEVLTNTAAILYGIFTQRAMEMARFKEKT